LPLSVLSCVIPSQLISIVSPPLVSSRLMSVLHCSAFRGDIKLRKIKLSQIKENQVK
jgi:hypothetical protein